MKGLIRSNFPVGSPAGFTRRATIVVTPRAVGSISSALALLQDACTVWEGSAAAAPDVTGFRQDLAGCYYYYGSVLAISDQPDVAAKYLEKSYKLLEACMIEKPQVREDFALVVCYAGQVLRRIAKPAEVLRFTSMHLVCIRQARRNAKRDGTQPRRYGRGHKRGCVESRGAFT